MATSFSASKSPSLAVLPIIAILSKAYTMRRTMQGQQSESGLTDGSQNTKVRAMQVPRDEGRGLLLGDSPKRSPHAKAPS